jgi:hypothetical protein
MNRNTPISTAEHRRAVILVVVLLLLSLFAVVALTFVLYADAAANAARIDREGAVTAVTANGQPWDIVSQQQMITWFLGQLIYDVADPTSTTSTNSSLRGLSLARSMYGYNSTNPASNNVPYNGLGRVPVASPISGTTLDSLINCLYYQGDTFVIDPERLAARANLGAAPAGYFPINAPYTATDLNSVFLGALSKFGRMDSNGNPLPQSYVRSTGFGPIDPSNANWLVPSSTNPALKYQVLRPRPIDQLLSGETWPLKREYFPLPGDAGGDVCNLPNVPKVGNVINDSIWVDCGFPVQTLPDGRKAKLLFAPYIIDLDNKLNVNVHGNIRGSNTPPTHVSHMGIGPWEVSLAKAFNNPEWSNLFLSMRYGNNGMPTKHPTQPIPTFNPLPRNIAQVNYSAADAAAPTGAPRRMQLPGVGSVPPFLAFPGFPSTTFGNTLNNELDDRHPELYNPLSPVPNDHAFGLPELEALLRYGDVRASVVPSQLLTLCPNSFNPNQPGALGLTRLLTVLSSDHSLPGVAAWQPAPSSTGYALASGALSPTGQQLPFPTLTASPSTADFYSDWRAVYSTLSRLDLNRSLPYYPVPDPNTGQIDFSNTPAGLANKEAFNAAQSARQLFAADIFKRLRVSTGAPDPTSFTAAQRTPPNYTPEYNAVRWLAQLAVNIVDYIDSDDYSTPWQWNPNDNTDWVYGTEVPRVVLNEVYVEFANDPADPKFGTTNNLSLAKGNVWVELANLFQPDPITQATPERSGAAVLEVPSVDPGTGTRTKGYPVYQVIISSDSTNPGASLDATLRAPAYPSEQTLLTTLQNAGVYTILGGAPNSLTPLTPQAYPNPGPLYYTADSNLLPTGLTNPQRGVNAQQILSADLTSNQGYNGPVGENKGFYVLGPVLNTNTTPPVPPEIDPFPIRTITNPTPPPASDTCPYPTLVRSEMSYDVGPRVISATITAAGSNYAVNDQLMIQGGTFIQKAILQVTAVDGAGAITGVSIAQPGVCSVSPTNPASVSGGAGSGATFTLTFSPSSMPTSLPATSVLLRRLACPHLPPQTDPTNTTTYYNPYIIVDYVQNVTANKAIQYAQYTSAASKIDYTPAPTAVASRYSYGKRQPYASQGTLVQQAPTPANGSQPQHTFFRHNAIESAPPINLTTTGPAGEVQTVKIPFAWLVHLDRQLISPMELLHVSAFKPQELTQQFVNPNGVNPTGATSAPNNNTFNHYAPWWTPNCLIYRVFEWLTTSNRTQGLAPSAISVTLRQPVVSAGTDQWVQISALSGTTVSGTPWTIQSGSVLIVDPDLTPPTSSNPPKQENIVVKNINTTVSPPQIQADFLKPHNNATTTVYLTDVTQRVPGKFNINTIWDEEPVQAMADADPTNPNNAFSVPDVTTIYQNIQNLKATRPFRSLATGATAAGGPYPGDVGLNDTILGNSLFKVTTNQATSQALTHPYEQWELLTKIYNNLTTRSNVFAVWLTVGYFQVIDDTSQPMKLGAEIGFSEGRNVRHRMFAIVDRSNLLMPVPVPGLALAGPVTRGTVSVTLTATSGSVNIGSPVFPTGAITVPWSIQVGSLLTVDTGSAQETVKVLAVNGTMITASFSQNHNPAAAVSINLPGNPGPQSNFDLIQPHYRLVVPYFSFIN